MKSLITTLAVLALAVVGLGGQINPAKPDNGVQKATIVVDDGFKPDTVNVKAGKPVQITFDVKHKACISSVVFKDLKIEKKLENGKKAVVTFTPKKAGSYSFACPMGMYKGTVVAK
ncbi:MAG: cupredoxin domain-containing protein [Fimbriimonadales bacterium]